MADEAERLAAVRRYKILDTPPDGAFDRVARLAADLFDVPIALVSLVDTDRIWFKSRVGLDDMTEIGRDPGLCASAILSDRVHVVTDARTDPRTLSNPFVFGDFGLQFYAGAPLVTSDGYRIGSLSVIDFVPRTVTEQQQNRLMQLAEIIIDEMEFRLASGNAIERERELRDATERQSAQLARLARTLQTALLPPQVPDIPGLEVAAAFAPANLDVVGGDFYDAFQAADRSWFLVLGDACGKGPRAAAFTAAVRHSVRAHAVHLRDPSDILANVNQTLLLDATRDDTSWTTLAVVRLQPTADGFTLQVGLGGHPQPLIARADGSVEHIGKHGTIVGVFADARFTTATIDLRDGDALVMFSDGVTEARIDREFFGDDGLADALLRRGGAGAEGVVKLVLEGLVELGAAQRDDVCLLVASVPSA